MSLLAPFRNASRAPSRSPSGTSAQAPGRKRGPRPRRPLAACQAAACLGLLLAACASDGSAAARAGGSGARIRVSLRGYSSGQLFELVSESHTDRVEYYSQARQDAARKIQADEVMAALVEELDRQGFDRYAKEGRAPSRDSTGTVSWGLEVEVDGRASSWLTGTGSPAEQRLAFGECRNTFLQLYNLSASYQTIENPSGPGFFDDQRRNQKLPGERSR